MKEALIFGEKEERLVSAMDIKNGFISKDHEFVDPEYEFKVIYVKGAKNGGMPHFRLYLSREDYNQLSPERKNKYDILRKMTYYKQSAWHSEWEEVLSHHMVIEKQIKDPETKKYKKADAIIIIYDFVWSLPYNKLSSHFFILTPYFVPVDPKPPAPLTVSDNSSTTLYSAFKNGAITIWAILSPGSTAAATLE